MGCILQGSGDQEDCDMINKLPGVSRLGETYPGK